MWFRQIFGGCTPAEYLTDGVASNSWGLYTPRIFDEWGSVKYLGGLNPQNGSWMWFDQIIGGSTAPKYLTDGVPSNIGGVYTPKMFHKGGSVKYLGAVHAQNISRMWFRQIFGGSTPPKNFKDVVLSNIWGVYIPRIFDGCGLVKYLGLYTPRIFDGWGSVKYLGGLHPKNISRMWYRQIFGGCTPRKKFHRCGSIKYLGALHPQNI